MKEKRIAISLFNVVNMKSGGGAERCFTRFFSYYISQPVKKYTLFFILDQQTFFELQHIGLKKTEEVLIVSGGGNNNSFYKYVWNTILLNLSFIATVFKNKIDLIHLPLPNGPIAPAIFFFSLLKQINIWKVKITLNIVSCYIAHDYFNTTKIIDPKGLRNFKTYFHCVFLDGVYSWYQLFVDKSKNVKFLGNPKITAAQYFFASSHHYTLHYKENSVLFAGRLVESKKPLLFIECVNYLLTTQREFFQHNTWKFKLFGGGPLSDDVEALIKKYHLENSLCHAEKYNLEDEFARSKIFVSLQDYENFTSLSLLEAMGNGNAVLAVNVGETERIVKDNINGILCNSFDVKEISGKLFQLMRDSKKIEEYSRNNNKIANTIHTIQNFTNDIELFWKSIFH